MFENSNYLGLGAQYGNKGRILDSAVVRFWWIGVSKFVKIPAQEFNIGIKRLDRSMWSDPSFELVFMVIDH